MDNTFSTLMSFQAQEETAYIFGEYMTTVGGVIKKSAMPTILTVGMLAQAGPVIEYERDIRNQSYVEIVK